jgi:hypothetical protein
MAVHHRLPVVESSVFDYIYEYIYLFNRLVGNIDCQSIDNSQGQCECGL